MIEARQLTKRFGGRTAIDDVSFRVEPGEVTGFLGPNGAGKTTTFRILAGVFPPTSGRALINGVDVVDDSLAARRHIGYVPERAALHLEMTVTGLLEFAAGMKDVAGRRARREAAERAIAETGLAGVGARRIGTLSKGYRQRVGLAQALVGEPRALLLDEPTAGLDPEQTAETRLLVRRLAAGRAVLVSSHALAEVETMCDRVVILHRGRVLAADRPAGLAARLRPASRIDIEAAAPADALAAALAAVPGVRRVDRLAGHDGRTRCRVETDPGQDLRSRLAADVTGRGWGLLGLAPVETSLEESFLALVAGDDQTDVGASGAAAATGTEAERESAHPGRRGLGACEQRSAAQPREQRSGPQKQ